MSADVTRQKYPFTLPELPYAYDALEPHIDQQTLQLHHRAHHATYVKNLNEALAQQPALHAFTLAQLLAEPAKLPEALRAAIVNNGGGHALHDLFWNCLAPASGSTSTATAPQGAFAEALDDAFGSFTDFRKMFTDAAAKHFASGWVAVTFDRAANELAIEELKDHTVPPPDEKTIVLILDVWEHAYYLKYQNRRPEFIEAFWNIVNWAHCEQLLSQARQIHGRAAIAARAATVGNF